MKIMKKWGVCIGGGLLYGLLLILLSRLLARDLSVLAVKIWTF